MLGRTCVQVLALLVCGVGLAEDGTERSLEEKIVVSPVILSGKVGNEAGTFKEGDTEYQKCGVVVQKVVRHPGDAPKEGATITIWGAEPPKKDAELVLFLGAANANGYPLRATAEAKELNSVEELLGFEAKAEKELEGKDKLRAAFFYAHKLRPVLLARAEGKDVRVAGGVSAEDRDKLLATLGWALAEAEKNDATAEFRALTRALQDVLTGTGGLPDFRTRRERLAQYFAQQLKNEDQRRKHDLRKLELTDTAEAQRLLVQGQGVARVVIGPGIVPPPGIPGTTPPVGRQPEPPAPTPPATSALGVPVNGLALQIHADRTMHELAKHAAEPIKITATLRNTGKAAFRLNTYMIFAALARAYIVEPGGRLIVHSEQDRLSDREVQAMGPWSFKELKPGESFEATTTIPPGFLKKEGTYTLCVEYENSYGKQFGIGDAWTGKVASPKIELVVMKQKPPVPAAPESPDPGGQPGPESH